ncbi:aminotransferase [Maribacter confluentis]|uniref:Aminotransferase n=1 Tax=Maribacter confluentis TaxID=1656093 RepID=A0ABT8RU36_9FLAO|nr:aminotransferase [Maribacter confluentis]MDO1514446.1 aminotransferase [Maribacter confluentis]
MKIISSSGKGNFKLVSQNQEICELEYTNWFSGKARTIINGNHIEIKPKNIWTSKVDISKNGHVIGDITFNLKGYMVIRMEHIPGKEINYVLKNKAVFKLRFELFDEFNKHQLTMKSVNSWSKLNYDYNIETGNYVSSINLEEMVVYCGYAANLYLALISAV